jgi:hypothetical protein
MKTAGVVSSSAKSRRSKKVSSGTGSISKLPLSLSKFNKNPLQAKAVANSDPATYYGSLVGGNGQDIREGLVAALGGTSPYPQQNRG